MDGFFLPKMRLKKSMFVLMRAPDPQVNSA
jgi:hypothetical protein